MASNLSRRQQHELDYHQRRAADFAAEGAKPVTLTRFTSHRYRWWNAYWVILWRARAFDLRDKRVLVVGGGFGEDAIFLNLFGAGFVCSIDISAASTRIAAQKARVSGASVYFHVSMAKSLPFKDGSFDLVYLPDILHHVDIPHAIPEVVRVLKPDGLILANEPYTHSWVQSIRNSAFVSRVLYRRLVKLVYGTDTPYITEDERKLSEVDIRTIGKVATIVHKTWFLFVSGRIVSPNGKYLPIIDRIILSIPGFGHLLAGRVVFAARRRL
jgi:ubiquinone/menaquinone biosynthesis C-methylase UbiE